jgi:hypothetical protein
LAQGLATTACPMARFSPHGPTTARGRERAWGGHRAPAGHGGVGAAGSPVAAADEGIHDGHQHSEGMAPGKVVVVEAHRGAQPMTRGGGGEAELVAALDDGCELR